MSLPCMHCAVVDESKESQSRLLLLLDHSATSCSASADLEVQKQSAALTMTSPAGLLQQASSTVAGTRSKGETAVAGSAGQGMHGHWAVGFQTGSRAMGQDW